MGQAVFPFAHAPLGRISRGRAPSGALAPRVSHAAVRVPDQRHTPLEFRFPSGHPQIFVHEGARQALERRLSLANGGPVILSVTDNVRQMVSHTLVTLAPTRRPTRGVPPHPPAAPPNPRSKLPGGILQVRLHHMFLDAPPQVQEALVRYVIAG